MQRISSLLAFLLNRWMASFAGLAVASMLVWYLGPLVPGFGSPLIRALLILAAVLVWAGVNGVLVWRRSRREAALAAGVTEDAGEAPGGARDAKADSAEEVARLRARLNAAVRRLRGNRRRGTLYEQPWFVLIGPPGAGKTTALLNCGLQFPLAQEDEQGPSGGVSGAAVAGVGGTRLCDWWFADEAVLIDTAGRYTTQDSDAAVDRAGWHGFLDLLRRTRPRQPINGVIVVLSLADLAAASTAERTAHANAVRRRAREISDRLRLRVPVYVVFSKADQLTGFNEYFDDLDAESRGQVLGMTFPLSKGVELFASEFRLLLDRLDARLFERLQAERAADRRALIAGFPLQVASLTQPLSEFLTQAFGGTRLDPAPFLRGVYVSSATQEGTPIDQLTGLLSRAFGIDQKRAPSLRPVAGRSYFLKRLVHDVVLGEALLVGTNVSRQRRRRWLRTGGFAAAGVATLLGGLLLWRVEAANRHAVLQAEAALAAYRSQLSGVTLDPISDDALPQVAPLLDSAATLPHAGGPWPTRMPGLSQASKLVQGDRLAYRNALQQILLPRLVWRLETQERARLGDPGFLYEATRVYLMLGGLGPLDRALVRDWEAGDWLERFPGVLNAPLREQLARHLDALLSEPLPPVTLDGALVSAARATFSRVPLDERVYTRIRAEAAPATIPDWTPAQALGPDQGPGLGAAPLFLRPSGKPLTEGVAGFYTADGFHRILLGRLVATTRAVADESWVLGRAQEVPSAGPAVVALEQAVVARWVDDTETRWDTLLDDLALTPFGDHDATVQRLYVLSSPQSPMRDLLAAITHQLDLHAAVAVNGKPAAAQDPSEASADAAFGQHFAGLRTLVEDGQDTGRSGGLPAGPSQSPLDGLLRLVSTLQQALADSGTPAASGGGDAAQLLLAESQRQPHPVSGWLRQIADSGRATLDGNAATAAAAAFSASTGPGALCRAVTTGRYPFDPASSRDAPLDDFARLFAPNGLLDSFFQTYLRPYVDMGGPVWRPRPADGIAAPVDAAGVARFQRAAAIRDAFFPTGGVEPQLRFSVAPLVAGAPARLALGNITVPENGQGSVPAPAAWPTPAAWPGADGMIRAAVSFDAADDAPALRTQGGWALFRLIDQAQVTSSGAPESFTLTWHSGARSARFTLQAGSSRNPFGRNLLEGFQCPVIR